MKRAAGRRALVCLMSMCLLAGMLPSQTKAAPGARAAAPKSYSINLQKDGAIAGIESPAGASVSAQEWSGSRLYFGKAGSNPVLWRVLDKGMAGVSGKKVMLLQSDKILETRAFNSSLDNDWAASAVKTYLNGAGAGGFLKGFSSVEYGSIYPFSKGAGAAVSGTVSGNGATVNNPAIPAGTRVFLLSGSEAQSPAYGYGSDKARRLLDLNGAAGSWWLRSGVEGLDEQIVRVTENGSLGSAKVRETDGIAPALCLDASKILFTTGADRAKPDFSKVSELPAQTEWKLTLLGSDRGMNASLAGGALHERGETVTLNHNSAQSALSGANQVSALITGADGAPLYYGKTGSGVGAASTSLTLPADIPAGSYSLYLFAEQVNGGKLTDYASPLGNPVPLSIDAAVTPRITAAPTAGAVTYGQPLRDCALSGGSAEALGNPVPGSFSWKSPDILPTVADSGSTVYEVVFTPSDQSKYKTVNAGVRIAVAKAAQAPNPPAASVTVEYGGTKVSSAALPQGWNWKAEDAGRELAVGANQATAVYQDTVNYENYTASVTIIRNDCAHTGGAANCTAQAVCDICHLPYGPLNPAQHGQLEVRDVKAASCTEKGHTGNTYCLACGQVVAAGQETAALGHDYVDKVTKEPTLDTDGIRTYTCKRCGDHYDENMGRHGHYYNGTKILHYVGCVQQGEVQHSCGCGDYYVEITPALGHDYTSAVTTKPTTGRSGVKTYTCTRCGHQYTEMLPKLSGGGSGSGDGGGQIPDRLPYVKGDSSLSGWPGINKAIGKAKDGDTINIGMNDTMVLPKKTLEALKGKNVTLTLDIGNQIKWSVNGKDITADALADLNLKVTKNSAGVPGELVKELAGELESLQFSLVHEGDFGGKMTLQLPVDSSKAGYYANLFYYNSGSGALEYIGSSQMDGKGVAGLEMTHASDYVIVADTKVMDGTEAKEPPPSTEQEPVWPEETAPVQGPEPEIAGPGGGTVNVILIIGLAVLCAGILAIILIRARNKSVEWA